MSEIVAVGPTAPPFAKTADLAAKAGLVAMLVVAIAFPDLSHLRDKAAGLRALTYPMFALVVPLVWWLWWRERAFPWLADLLITLTCFSDILGNQMNLYDSVVWFDDWMHFMNTGLVAAGVVVLTMGRAPFLRVLERALAVGATAAIAWEIAEFFAFLRWSPERGNGYSDTLGDLGLGTLGAVIAAVVLHVMWQQGRLSAVPAHLRARSPGAGPVATRRRW